jgi:hypothetical protein
MNNRMYGDVDADKLPVMAVLPNYVGHSCALLLRLVGYKNLADLASASSLAITGIPGVGPARLRGIEKALNDRGMMLKAAHPPAMPVVTPQPPGLWLN